MDGKTVKKILLLDIGLHSEQTIFYLKHDFITKGNLSVYSNDK